MEDFVSEPLTPDPGSFDTAPMARGEPGLPTGFTWRGRHYVIREILEAWKTCGRDGESVYLRHHWFRLRTDDATVLTIYCQRQATRASAKHRWWVYSATS